jgi:glucan biosynthesis protein C
MSLPQAVPLERRYDIDWLRVIAISLLIIYHNAITFQPWALFFGLPQNKVPMEIIWPAMAMMNVWRIPLLFMVSGMGVCFAMRRRKPLQLIQERSIRILLPYFVGIAILGPILNLSLPALGWDAPYSINFGHLWFLLNIYLYTVSLAWVLEYLIKHPENWLFQIITRVMRLPLGLFILCIPLCLEALLINPKFYSLFVGQSHGWLVGLIVFVMGFCFVAVGDPFWTALKKTRWVAFGLGSLLFATRFFVFKLENYSNLFLAIESYSWMLTALGFSAQFLNRPSRLLKYCSTAVFPVYILHMPIQFALSYFVLPTELSPAFKFVFLTAGTFVLSVAIYEFPLRRLKWIRPAFGIKW